VLKFYHEDFIPISRLRSVIFLFTFKQTTRTNSGVNVRIFFLQKKRREPKSHFSKTHDFIFHCTQYSILCSTVGNGKLGIGFSLMKLDLMIPDWIIWREKTFCFEAVIALIRRCTGYEIITIFAEILFDFIKQGFSTQIFWIGTLVWKTILQRIKKVGPL